MVCLAIVVPLGGARLLAQDDFRLAEDVDDLVSEEEGETDDLLSEEEEYDALPLDTDVGEEVEQFKTPPGTQKPNRVEKSMAGAGSSHGGLRQESIPCWL